MKRFITLAACLSLTAPAFAQVEPAQAPDLPIANDASLERSLQDAERDRAAAKLNDHDSRMALQHYGSCVAESSAGEAGRVIAMDFTTPTYRNALKLLSQDAAKFCADKAFGTGVLRSANLLFAGEVAEALVEKSGGSVAGQLAKAAAAPATTGFALTDKVAICVVRSVPDQVAAVFATERDSAEETAAITALSMPVQLCAKAVQATKPMSISPAGLRAMLATAAFRSIRSAGTAS